MNVTCIGALSVIASLLLATGCGGSHAANGGVGSNLLPQTSAVRPVFVAPKEILSYNGNRDAVLYAFQGGEDGAAPLGSLVSHKDGTLYGTSRNGGGSSRCNIGGSWGFGCGTIFELVPSGKGYTETLLHRFKGGVDGTGPYAALTEGANGVFFGTTVEGGINACSNGSRPDGCGTVFSLTPSASGYTKRTIHTFKGGTDGYGPLGALLVGSHGVLYGTAEFGANSGCSTFFGTGCGTVFKLTPSRRGYRETTAYEFAGGSDGGNPYAALIALNGRLYGTTAHGGSTACDYGCGTVFELNPTKTGYSERVLYRFKGGKDGQWPKAGLIADASDALYGTTEGGGGTYCTSGGLNGCGTVFKLTLSRRERVLYRFRGKSDGAWPYSGLVADTSGALYGAAWSGGKDNCQLSSSPAGCGTVFKLTVSGTKYTESTVYAFKGGITDGELPLSAPIFVKGLLYGTTSNGGNTACVFGCGIVYKVRP